MPPKRTPPPKQNAQQPSTRGKGQAPPPPVVEDEAEAGDAEEQPHPNLSTTSTLQREETVLLRSQLAEMQRQNGLLQEQITGFQQRASSSPSFPKGVSQRKLKSARRAPRNPDFPIQSKERVPPLMSGALHGTNVRAQGNPSDDSGSSSNDGSSRSSHHARRHPSRRSPRFPQSSYIPADTPFQPRLSARLPDPAKLEDLESGPNFASWKKLIIGKLTANGDHYPTELDKMIFVFGCTEGGKLAQELLEPRHMSGEADEFVSYTEMIDYLAETFDNGLHQSDAKRSYDELIQLPNEIFSKFKVVFVRLATEAKIPEVSRKDDLFKKLNITLQQKFYDRLHQWPNVREMMRDIEAADAERVAMQDRLRREASREPTRLVRREQARVTSVPAVRTPGILRHTPAVRFSPAPDRHTSPSPALKIICYNCGQEGHKLPDCPLPQQASRRTPGVNEIEKECDNGEAPEEFGSDSEFESKNFDA